MTALREILDALQEAYPHSLAEPWDAVGLVCGDPAEEVRKVVVCVDPDPSTVDDVIACDAQLLVAHHPLLLRGVHGVPADEPKGDRVHRLVRAGAALFCAHTNADAASPGVSDALAAAIGLRVLRPLVPHEDGRTGIGRICELPLTETLSDFVRRVARSLPATEWGARGAGDPDRPIRTVAVAGGAGDGLLGEVAAAGVDAYVTADLRHHPAAEHVDRAVAGRVVPALVDVAHWASEWPWCEQAAEVIRAVCGGSVEVLVSTRCTDPWTVHAASNPTGRTEA